MEFIFNINKVASLLYWLVPNQFQQVELALRSIIHNLPLFSAASKLFKALWDYEEKKNPLMREHLVGNVTFLTLSMPWPHEDCTIIWFKSDCFSNLITLYAVFSKCPNKNQLWFDWATRLTHCCGNNVKAEVQSSKFSDWCHRVTSEAVETDWCV